jgi:hypothetical protein
VKEPLERQLETLQEPGMPADVEARVRRRLASERAKPAAPSWRRYLWRGSYAQLALLVVLLAMASWVMARQVYPVLVSAWERYCTPHESAQNRVRP